MKDDERCFTCRKRQIKCDYTKPKCERCKKDSRQCRGYRETTRFVLYRHRGYEQQAPDCKRRPPRAAISSLLPVQCDDYLDLIQSFRYYDEYVMPRLIPAHQAFRRRVIDRQVPWHVLPTFIQHCMTLSLRSMFLEERDSNPKLLKRSLYFYRSSIISQLQGMLHDAVTDPYGIALAGMILLMGADISQCRFGAWSVHFDAVQKIISLRGGIERVMLSQPQSRSLLIQFIVADIMTGATCPSSILVNTYSFQHEYDTALSGKSRDLLNHSYLCPLPILQAINQVNLLRATVSRLPLTSSTIFSSLVNFNTQTWAESCLSEEDSQEPVLQGNHHTETVYHLSRVGRVFQLTSLLYLLHSCPRVLGDFESISVAEIRKETIDLLGSIVESGQSDCEGPISSQTWKFLRWPLFVSAYVGIGWYSEDRSSLALTLDTISKFQKLSASSGSVSSLGSEEYLSFASENRAMRHSWSWDDGFRSRCGIVL